ncbi:hypothetical protein DFQ28_011322 [Apophysomyces sp. BC1034]|nr:hypothetical protein DFQ28_011322 [Apophysomyces sp. BC1034]
MEQQLLNTIKQLNDQNASLTKTIQSQNEEIKSMRDQMSQLMTLFLGLKEKLDTPAPSAPAPTLKQKVTKTPAPKPRAFGEGSSVADSIHATPALSKSVPDSYAAKAAKAVKVTPRPTKKKTRAPTTDAIKRILSESTGLSQYDFVYLPCKHHLKHSAVRKMLHLLKIPQARVIDVQFPAKGTVALLVHSDYKVELESILRSQDITVKQGFNPCNADIVGDIQHATKTIEERSSVESELHLSGIVKIIHPDMSKVILSSLPNHLTSMLDYTPNISPLDPDTSTSLKRILDFGCNIDYIIEIIMTTKTRLIRDKKRSSQQYTNLCIIEKVVENLCLWSEKLDESEATFYRRFASILGILLVDTGIIVADGEPSLKS